MGSRQSVDQVRGLLLPDTRLELWTAQSGEYNAGVRVGPLPTAGARAGVPTSTSTPTPKMRLRALGSQTIGTTLEVRCIRGGLPAPGGAGVAWNAGGDWLGWDAPSVLTGWEPLAMATAGAAGARTAPHVAALSDGRAVAVYQVRGAGTYYSIFDNVRATDGTWTESTVAIGGTRNSYSSPTSCERSEDGRVLLYAWVDDQDEEVATVQMWYTDDLTSAWQVGSRHALPSRVDTSAATSGWILGRLRVAYGAGQVLLLASMRTLETGVAGAHDVLVQYASSDGGHTFVEVARTSTAVTSPQKEGAAYHDVVYSRGAFYVGYVDVGDARAKVVRLGSAFEPFAGATAVECYSAEPWATADGGGDYHVDGDFVLVADEIGTLYAMGRLVTASNPWMVVRSTDQGATWDTLTTATATSTPGAAMALLDAASYPSGASACWLRNRAVMVHGATSSPSTYGGGSLWAAYLGGPSTVTMPVSRANADGEPDITTWHGTYLPIDLPSDVGWARTATGAASQSIATGLLVETIPAADTAFHDRTPSGTVGGGQIVVAAVDVSGGVAVLRVRLADATEGYEIVVSVSATTVSCSDGISGGAVGSAATHGGGEVLLLVGLEGSRATVWYLDYSTDAERAWTQVATTAVLTDAAGSVTTNRLRFGAISAAASDRVHTWRGVWWTGDGGSSTRDYLGEGLATPPTSPTDLAPRTIGSVPTYLGEGVSVWGYDGPAYRGDTWEVAVDYDYDPEDVLPHVEASPRRGWRSAARTTFDASTTHLHLAYRVPGGEDVLPGNDLWALWLDEMNFGAALVDVYTGGGWVNVATISKISFSGDRRGSTVRPAAASSLGTLLRRGELEGAGVTFLSGGGTVVDWVGKVNANTEGTLAPASVTAKRAILQLEGSNSGLSATPTVELWPRRVQVLVHPSGVAAAIQGIRLRIPVSTSTALPGVPYDGYYALGVLAFGPMWVCGLDYSSDRVLGVDPITELVTLADGTRRARVLARPRRRVGVHWTDGVVVSDVRTSDNPDYVTASDNTGAEGVALAYDVALGVSDLVTELSGASRLVVYMPHVKRDTTAGASGDAQVVTRDWGGEAIYGRVVSPVTVNQVMGEELVDDVYRVMEIVIEEER